MIITGNRQDEIIARTTKRLVTAMIHVAAPLQTSKPQNPGTLGLFIENKKSVFPLSAQNPVAQDVDVWQWEDECVIPLEKKSEVFLKAVEVIKTRTKRVNSGEFPDLDTQKAVFDSKDVISHATGVPAILHFEFIDAAKTKGEIIDTVPFVRLKDYLKNLEAKLEPIGGQVISADVAHVDSMSAFEYYEIGFGHHMGRKFTYGDVMIARAKNMLRQIANRPTPDSKLN